MDELTYDKGNDLQKYPAISYHMFFLLLSLYSLYCVFFFSLTFISLSKSSPLYLAIWNSNWRNFLIYKDDLPFTLNSMLPPPVRVVSSYLPPSLSYHAVQIMAVWISIRFSGGMTISSYAKLKALRTSMSVYQRSGKDRKHGTIFGSYKVRGYVPLSQLFQ